MAHVQFMDELIREYLLFRGFNTAVKSLDNDLKNEKERGFRVDKIVDQILHYVNTYDLVGLKEIWGHLDSHMFSKLESPFTGAVKKLENAVLKLYLVNAAINNKPEKITEFFTKMTSELQSQTEWKDWFMLPYIKNPEENPIFSVHFTRQWQDTLLVSLHNFLASIFQYMPIPTLMAYEEDTAKLRKLEEKNESLKSRLALLMDKGSDINVTPVHVEPPPHLLDDFYIIAQENTTFDNQAKGLKNLIRSMGTSTSPILGRKESSNSTKKRLATVSNKSSKQGQSQFYDP
ncbi:WD repeat-containing protein 91 [Agrilus planipennis]|uniref:WD repeat-containing protein 91 n=1 Tax=Agrilus planipennis TaxID=224129 RepID=A0A1W4XHQ4_AGRPL|nr:WD repeat-containing protein 91 [Agrilus planipennis]XP_018335658.1 WD repeat-containing protein 91 [Agrilus planipennis]